MTLSLLRQIDQCVRCADNVQTSSQISVQTAWAAQRTETVMQWYRFDLNKLIVCLLLISNQCRRFGLLGALMQRVIESLRATAAETVTEIGDLQTRLENTIITKSDGDATITRLMAENEANFLSKHVCISQSMRIHTDVDILGAPH